MAAGAAPKKRATEASISSTRAPRGAVLAAAPRGAAASCRGGEARRTTESALPARRGRGCAAAAALASLGREAGSRHVLKSSSLSSSSSATSDSLCSAGLVGAAGAGATARCASREAKRPEPGLVVAAEHALSPVATLTPPDTGLALRTTAQDGGLTDAARPADSGHATDLSETAFGCPVLVPVRKRL